MTAREQEISFSLKARYYKLGDAGSAVKQCWYVIHGYAQLARYFIQKFNILASQNISVIAPEGLSKFYLEDHKGKVGASWMTKENRLTDIANYVDYLNAIYNQERHQYPEEIPTTVLGFSQGAATAARWLMNGKVRFEKLILWGGLFPPDMDFDKAGKIFSDKKVYLVYGNEDPFLKDEKFAEAEQIKKKLGIHPEIVTFNGGHIIDLTTLQQLI